jgi:hypothetical protein
MADKDMLDGYHAGFFLKHYLVAAHRDMLGGW